MTSSFLKPFLVSLTAALALAGCGGGKSATVGGNLTGLNSGLTVVIQNSSNSDTLTLTSNHSFAFTKGLASSAAYNVIVLTQPVGQTCTVANASGSISTSNASVTNVAVSCAVTSSVGVTVSGLASGTSVTLALSNGQTLAVAANGLFAFPGTLTTGTSYSVSVATQPAGKTCVVSNGSGTVVANTMASVSVACS